MVSFVNLTLLISPACCLFLCGCGKKNMNPALPLPNGQSKAVLDLSEPRDYTGENFSKILHNPLFDHGNLDHRIIRTAIHLQSNHGIDARVGSMNSSGLVIMPRRDGPELTRDNLGEVKELDLSAKELSDLGPLAGLTAVKSLYLNNNPISDISPLSNLRNLWALSLNGCQMENLMPLENMNGLVYLNLEKNHVRDLAPIAGLKRLEIIGLSGNQIINLMPLAGMEKVYHLELAENRIKDLSPLAGLENLRYLSIENNPDLTEAEVVKLQKALPKCEVRSNARK